MVFGHKDVLEVLLLGLLIESPAQGDEADSQQRSQLPRGASRAHSASQHTLPSHTTPLTVRTLCGDCQQKRLQKGFVKHFGNVSLLDFYQELLCFSLPWAQPVRNP